MFRFSSWLALVCAHALLTEYANANGVLRDGVGGGFALGGADVAFAKDPLMAMHRNPATLGLLEAPTISFGLTGIHADATFEDASGSRTDLRQDSGAFPDLALAYPIANTRFTLWASLITETALRGDWRYEDALGGVDGATSYGRQSHYSEFMAIRAALGLNVDLTDKLAIGMSVGAVYHRVSLDVPFIFQSHPSLAGWKTLLDLDTGGYGWNADLGLHYHFLKDLHIGRAYRSRTHLRGTGNAHGSDPCASDLAQSRRR